MVDIFKYGGIAGMVPLGKCCQLLVGRLVNLILTNVKGM